MITVNSPDNTWIVNPDMRSVGESALDKTYEEAVQFCQEQNQNLPSPKDILTSTLIPTDDTSATWTAGGYIAYFTDNIIGQSSVENSTAVRKVICMDGDTIEKKHDTESITVMLSESNSTTTLQGIRDIVTGLSWTPIHTYDKDTINTGHANESRFPISGAEAPLINANEYCQKFGSGWRLPTLAELRTICYLDGTTGLNDPEGLMPTVIWTSTPGVDAGTSYVIHLNPNDDPTMAYYSESPEANGDTYFVTCVK